MEKKSYIFLSSIFVSLPLILTLLAAKICHFLIAVLNVFSSAMNFVSFLFFLFVLFCQFRSSSFSVIGVSVMVVEGNSRTHDHGITKFSRILQVIFFFARARASLILILHYGKWLIINSVIFSNSCPVIAEMHILS